MAKPKPILVVTNKRSYTVLPGANPKIAWEKGEKVIEITPVDKPEKK